MARDREVFKYLAQILGLKLTELTPFTPLGDKAAEIVAHLETNFDIRFEGEMPEKIGHIIGALLRPAPD